MMSEKRGLYAVGGRADAGAVDVSATAEPVETAGRRADELLQAGIMHAAASWIEMVTERYARAVSIQPVGGFRYEVDAEMEDGTHESLSVFLEMGPGLILRTAVQRLRPS